MSDQANKTNLTLGFIRTAYKDYIAARVLLNKDYTIQGVMFASTAIEKSYKAAICLFTGEKIYGHMDKFEKIERVVRKMGYGVLIEKIDPRFLEILGKAYKLRYYDDIKETTTIGFFKNQFLGELDGAMALFEQLFIFSNEEGKEPVLTPLKMDLKAGNPDLIENNWVAQNIDKRKFMETDCEGFAIHILPGNLYQEINVSSKKITVPYNDNRMTLINVKGDNE